jgi:hypothetical protein
MHHSSAFRITSLCERLFRPSFDRFAFRLDIFRRLSQFVSNPPLGHSGVVTGLVTRCTIETRTLADRSVVAATAIARRWALILFVRRPFPRPEKRCHIGVMFRHGPRYARLIAPEDFGNLILGEPLSV